MIISLKRWWKHLWTRRTCQSHGCGAFYKSYKDDNCVLCRLPDGREQ